MNPSSFSFQAHRTVSIQRTFTAGVSSQVVLEESSDRIGLIFNAPNAGGRLTLSLEAEATLDQGLTLYPENEPLILTLQDHGQLVTLGWSVIGSAADIPLTIIETFLRS